MLFKDITAVNYKLQLIVREWRNHIDIRKNMYTDKVISAEEHQAWINSLVDNESIKVYVVFKNDDAIGVTSIYNIDKLHKNADWAFYLNPDFFTAKGLGTLIEYHFINHIFDNFEIQKLNCEVLQINPSVIKLHRKFGFIEEGIRRKNVIKNNERIDVFFLGILKEEWNQIKSNFTKVIERLEK